MMLTSLSLVHRARLIPSSPSTTNSSQGSDQLASSQNAGVQGSSVDTGGLVECALSLLIETIILLNSRSHSG